MNYQDVRSQITSGDLLGVSRKGLFWSLVRCAQRIAGLENYAEVTHIGVAWWLEGRLYSVEMDGSDNALIPVSQFISGGAKTMVLRCPVPSQAMAAQFERATSTPISYDYFDLIKIGLRLLFRTNPHADSNSDMVCSTFASRWLQWAGWASPENYPSLPSPGELAKALGDPIFQIDS